MAARRETELMERLAFLESELKKRDELLLAVRRSEQKYRHFFEKSPAMIYVVDKKGRFININRAGVELLGFSKADEVIGKGFNEFFFIDDDSLENYCDLIEQQGYLQALETKLRRRDGELRDVQINAAKRTSVSGKMQGYEGFVIDISRRKEAERLLAQSEAKYRTVLENSLAAVYMFQDGGYFSYVNPRMVHILGYESADEIVGRPFWAFVAEEDRDFVKRRGLEREKREIYPRRYKFRLLRKDGSKIWVDMRSSHASYLGTSAVVGNFIDITREKEAEEEIRRLSQRLINAIEEERRRLAADLHDDFGQLLTLTQLDVEALARHLDGDQKGAQALCAKAMAQIQQLADKVRDTTSKLRPQMLDHLGLVPTLKWSVEELRQRRPHVKVELQVAGLKRRLAPETELVLYRVFQEGLRNIDRHAQASSINIQLTYSHPQVIFIIKDDGVGFDVDGARRGGTDGRSGMGLLIMQERVSFLGGRVHINSSPGKGTTIRVEIPT